MTKPNFKQIDAHQAKALIDKVGVAIVDIRDSDAFKAAHIENAHHLTDQNVDTFLKNTNKETPVICYCYHGFSSQGAAEFLATNGFIEVYSIEGGFEKWKTLYPTKA